MRPSTLSEAVKYLVRGIRGVFTGHEFHEFHENDHCAQDLIGLEYNFFTAPHGRAITTRLTIAPRKFKSRSLIASLSHEVHLVDPKLTDWSSFVSWPGRPCQEAIVARASRP